MGTSKDLEIPKGVISKLRNLKCIQSYNCRRLQSEDLNCLEDLQEFWSWFDELHNFNRLVKNIERLKCYNIRVSSSSDFYMQSLPLGSNVKKVDFKGINFTLVLIPANITSLHIEDCEGLNGCIADYLQSIIMSNLKELYVVRCTEVEWILNSEQIIENASNTGATPFKSLEVLSLKNLPKLISVCKGEDVILPANCTFSSLKQLFITGCDSMKKLLPHALLQNLKNLEALSVKFCYQLEVVIGGVGGDGEEEGSSNTPIYLPKLKELYLDILPELKSICNGREMICPSIENISIWGCTNVKMMPSFLPINEATEQPYIPSSFQKIKLFKDEKEWWESLELHNPNAKHILQSHIECWHILMRMRAPTEGSCDHIRMAYSCFGIVQRLKVESREEMRERDEARNQIQKVFSSWLVLPAALLYASSSPTCEAAIDLRPASRDFSPSPLTCD
nr:probable disease resistance protein At4g27220 [Ipomoea batatas]